MQELSFPQMKRVKQISASHCGPATARMLLSFSGFDAFKQDQIVEAAGVTGKLNTHGTTIGDLALAVRRLVPQVNLWYKDQATVEELDALVNEYRVPVGVEWQGVFLDIEEDDDPGHYSVATYVSIPENLIRIADPYHHYPDHDRTFKLSFFDKRWWDTNEMKDPVTGRNRYLLDERMMFVILPREITFPKHLGMVQDFPLY